MSARIAFALSLCSCQSRLETIDLSNRDDVVAFAVTFDDDLRVLRTSDPFRVVGGAIAFGKRPEIVLADDEASAALIEIDWAAFASSLSSLDASRLPEMTVRPEQPPPAPEISFDDPRIAFSRRALPLGMVTIEGAEDVVLAAALQGVTMRVPVDPEWCRPTARMFEPFGGSVRPFPSGGVSDLGFRRVVRAGDRALILASTRAHVLSRGGFIDGTFDTVDFPSVLGPGALGATVDLDQRIDGSIVAAALATGRTTAIVELSIETSSLTYVRTTTIVSSTLTDLGVSTDGRSAFATTDRSIYLEEGGRLERIEIDDTRPGDRAQGIAWTSDVEYPLVTSTRNHLHVFDAASRSFRRIVLPVRFETELINIDGLDATEGVVWAVGNQGYVVRLIREELFVLELGLPPRALLCVPSGDFGAIEEHFIAVAIMDGYLYILRQSCNSVIAVRLDDGCVSLLPVDGDPRVLVHDAEGLLDLHASDGVIVVVGRAGHVFRLEI